MPEKVIKTIYQYAAKVIQGEIKIGGKITPIGPGAYFTSINIHNPWRHPVKYAVKVAISGQNGKWNSISNFQSHILGPDATTEYDHVGFDFLLHPISMPPFLEGYFVIESEEELDVVGVYTGAAIQDQHLGAMHMERIPKRIVPACKDLRMDIGTGSNKDWMLQSVPSASSIQTGPAPIVNSHHPDWADPISPAQWIGIATNTSPGDYVYELRFCLCWTFRNAQIIFDLWADNHATMSLNGIPTSPPITSNPGFGPSSGTHVVIPSANFRIGENILTVTVTNTTSFNSPSGMLLQGSLSALDADCIS
jgi:hypothetical protein